MFTGAMMLLLGDGSRAKFWHDNWIKVGLSIESLAPILCTFVHKFQNTVAEAICNHTWVRDIRGGLSVQAIREYLQVWDIVASIQLVTARHLTS